MVCYGKTWCGQRRIDRKSVCHQVNCVTLFGCGGYRWRWVLLLMESKENCGADWNQLNRSAIGPFEQGRLTKEAFVSATPNHPQQIQWPCVGWRMRKDGCEGKLELGRLWDHDADKALTNKQSHCSSSYKAQWISSSRFKTWCISISSWTIKNANLKKNGLMEHWMRLPSGWGWSGLLFLLRRNYRYQQSTRGVDQYKPQRRDAETSAAHMEAKSA